MKKPILYIQSHPDNIRLPLFDFCYSAKLGALGCNIKVKHFIDSLTVPGNPTNILVGSVEMCSKWLDVNNYGTPCTISLDPFSDFLGRNTWIVDSKDIQYPVFIKPLTHIKAFTGFVADDALSYRLFSNNYNGLLLAQDIIEIVSEYRLYLMNHKVVGMKHYAGDCFIFPDANLIQQCVDKAKEVLDNHSYSLDFGILKDGSTILIEINDGWALGNYGLDPYDYYLFIRNRWLQMTGIRKRME